MTPAISDPSLISLFTVAEIRNFEAAFAAAHPKIPLMQRAGDAVAKKALSILKKSKSAKKNILVLVGPGNNGGDAWIAAETLRQAKCHVTVLALGEQQPATASQKAIEAFAEANGEFIKSWPKKHTYNLVVDGLFGIGISKAPTGAFADVIRHCNRERMEGRFSVLSIDVPSGVNADTGVAFEPAIEADETITFIGAKPGLYTADGVDHAGAVTVESIGVTLTESTNKLLIRENVLPLIPHRRANSHKGSYGNVGIIGGAEGMAGAAVVAARAALHMGPGKVYLGLFDKDRPALDLLHPEMMLRDAKLLCKDENMTAFAVGMGMGETGTASLLGMLTLDKPMVIDADAISAISINPSIRAAFETKKAEIARPCLPFIFTPHPGEAAQLLGIKTVDVQSDRIAAARAIAAIFACVVVLKGAGTVIAKPDGQYVINTSGNPGMASGGMGDALSGMLAALLAMGLDVWDAARLGVYLHGAAADAALQHGMGPHGLTASDVIFEARLLLNSGLDHHHED